MQPASSITLATRITDLPGRGVPRFGLQTARQLALSLAEVSTGKDINTDNLEALLSYLPARYEDRSSMVEIRHLYHGLEASLDLTVRIAGGFQVRNRRSLKQRLYIFEISAADHQRRGRPVVVWWFISGARAQQIIQYNARRFLPGTRFIAFGQWEWDKRRGTYSLRLNKPDELELVTGADNEEGEIETDPTLAAVHVGRRVPIYRKLGDFRTKRLREIVHQSLGLIPDQVSDETLPAELRARQKLIARGDALRYIHFPAEDAALDEYHNARSPAHRRLIFEELFW